MNKHKNIGVVYPSFCIPTIGIRLGKYSPIEWQNDYKRLIFLCGTGINKKNYNGPFLDGMLNWRIFTTSSLMGVETLVETAAAFEPTMCQTNKIQGL
jgi:hypothetical protein